MVVIRLQDVIRAPKTDIRVGEWRRGAVPKAEFPIAKASYSLGSSFEWCVIRFDALGQNCRVLVIFNPAKQIYEAILGICADSRMRILCSYEYHAGEPGWHVHASCGDASRVPLGFMRGPWVRRLPRARRTHNRRDFEILDRDAAKRAAFDRYKIETKGSLL